MAWTSLTIACGLYIFGLLRFIQDAQELKSFHLNIIVEGIGLFVAVAIAWWWFERRQEDQARRIELAVRPRVARLRNFAATAITNITTTL